jgi:hypothetical protein
MTDAEIATVRSQPSWPNRVAAAHTIPREARVTPQELFDADEAARVTVPSLLLSGSESPATLKEDTARVVGVLPDARIPHPVGTGPRRRPPRTGAHRR